MSIIKLKRGARASLTTLNTGEAAFTIDTKELFIGDGSNNINLTPFNKNYLVNSNFQYPLITSDIINYSSIFLQAYAKKYIYGNYFVSNSTPSNGTISIDLSTNSNGMCRFTCNNAVPKIDYRLKLPRYKSGSNTYDYSSPLENKVLTLSFDVKNLNPLPINVSSGSPNDLKQIVFPVGTSRISNTFTFKKYTLQGRTEPIMDIVITEFTAVFNGVFEIGNIKLEEGNIQTKYVYNSLDEDILALNLSYKVINDTLRASFITNNTLEFNIQNDRSSYYDYSATINILKISVYSISGIPLTNITSTVTYETSNSIKVVVTKNNHGLTDASASIQLEVDYRPY